MKENWYKTGEKATMDFLTGMAYWGILVLIVANAIFVSRMKVDIHDDDEEDGG